MARRRSKKVLGMNPLVAYALIGGAIYLLFREKKPASSTSAIVPTSASLPAPESILV